MTKILYILLFLFIPFLVKSQENAKIKRWELKGYLSDLQMFQFQKAGDPWVFDNEVNNRLDFSWYPGKVFKMGIGMRNRFLFGQTLTNNPDYKGSITSDPGLVNMTWALLTGKSFLLVSQFDRAWISVTAGKVQCSAGRQRINWGQTIVWNPNDIFNTYSFYDFDYPERPGSDAVRIQYYPTSISVLEGAASWNNMGKITVAGLYRFNIHKYDIQFLAGLVNDQDYVIGTGWSGNIGQAAFRGEISYFQPKEKFGDTTGLLLATMGVDYSFTNSLSLTGQVFYNQLPPDYLPESLFSIYEAPPSPKTLSFSEWNIFFQGAYLITPLFNTTLAVMYYPNLAGYFIGPSFSFSAKENLELDLFIQYFNGRFKNSGQSEDRYIYFQSCLSSVRIKWNF